MSFVGSQPRPKAAATLHGVSSYVDAWDWMVHTNFLASSLPLEFGLKYGSGGYMSSKMGLRMPRMYVRVAAGCDTHLVSLVKGKCGFIYRTNNETLSCRI